jgi:chromosome partitioning protein
MIAIAVVNSKGGVGKTTLAAALAVRAARDSKLVAMVDLDPQKSLVEWWKRRGRTENPTIFEGVEAAADAVERADMAGYEWCFLDGPPAFLTVLEEMVSAADFTLIPVKPSVVDLLATEDAVVLARDAGAPFLCAFNDVGVQERVVEKAREVLSTNDIPIADTQIVHRVSHITGMNAGKSAAEVNGGRDTKAAEEIDRLWQEVKAAATKAARARRAKTARAVSHG